MQQYRAVVQSTSTTGKRAWRAVEALAGRSLWEVLSCIEAVGRSLD